MFNNYIIQTISNNRQTIKLLMNSNKQPQSPTRKQNVNSYKIKQFEWYEVQNKVRQLMVEILQPFNKKQTQQTVRANQMKRAITALTKKQQEHSFLLQQEGASKPKYIQIHDQQIARTQQQLQQLSEMANIKLKKMESTIQVYEEKINQLNQLQLKVDQEIGKRVKEFEEYRKQTNLKIDVALNKIQSQSEDINLIRTSTRNSLNKTDLKIVAQENRIKEAEDDVRRKSKLVDKLSEDVINNNQKMTKLQLKNVQIDNRLAVREKDALMSQKFFAVVDDVKNDLRFIKSYLQKYQPLYTQMQISQTLNIFLQGKSRRLMCLYEEERFAKIHNDILQSTGHNLEERMADYSTRIRAIINRNKKYIINLKVDRSIRFGQNVYEIRSYDDQLDRKEQSDKKVNIIIPQNDIIRIVQQKWLHLLPQLKLQVNELIKPTNVWMEELQQQFLLRTVKADTQVQQLYKNIQSQANQFQLHKSLIQNKYKDNSTKEQYQKQIFNSIIELMKEVISFGSVINHIVIQDQIDRQGLALYALKGGNISQNQRIDPTIQLDTKCLGCNSGSQLINQAFKMACLTYNPSSIKIDSQTFTRQQILEVSTNILQKIKSKIESMNWETETASSKNKRSIPSIQQQPTASRRTQSQLSKDIRSTTVNVSKTIDNRPFQTLLPILGSSKKKIMKDSSHISSFY